AAAQTRLAVAEDIPGKAEPPGQVVVVPARAVRWYPGVPAERYPRRCIAELRRSYSVAEVRNREPLNPAAHLVPRGRWLIAQPQVKGQWRAHFECVLEEQSRVGRPVVPILAGPLVEGSQLAQQEICNGVAGSGRGVCPKHIVAGPAELVHDIHTIAGDLPS